MGALFGLAFQDATVEEQPKMGIPVMATIPASTLVFKIKNLTK
jgi:hypothetical protein